VNTTAASASTDGEHTLAGLCIDRLARDEDDRQLLYDAVFDEGRRKPEPAPKPEQSPPAEKPTRELHGAAVSHQWSTYAGYVPAGPARARVQELVDAGMTQIAIAKAAGWDKASINRLLHGDFRPGRPPVEAIKSVVSERLLAVELVLPEPAPVRMPDCAPARPFTPAGYRVGRCGDCGRLAATRIASGGEERLISHPPLELAVAEVSA
jgi:hypothetical protein